MRGERTPQPADVRRERERDHPPASPLLSFLGAEAAEASESAEEPRGGGASAPEAGQALFAPLCSALFFVGFLDLWGRWALRALDLRGRAGRGEAEVAEGFCEPPPGVAVLCGALMCSLRCFAIHGTSSRKRGCWFIWFSWAQAQAGTLRLQGRKRRLCSPWRSGSPRGRRRPRSGVFLHRRRRSFWGLGCG